MVCFQYRPRLIDPAEPVGVPIVAALAFGFTTGGAAGVACATGGA
jgi:hypothetical protein